MIVSHFLLSLPSLHITFNTCLFSIYIYIYIEAFIIQHKALLISLYRSGAIDPNPQGLVSKPHGANDQFFCLHVWCIVWHDVRDGRFLKSHRDIRVFFGKPMA